jgi:hypothetical protein
MRSYNEIINWLEKDFKSKSKVKCYRGFEYSTEFENDVEKAKNQKNEEHVEFSIDPRLPVDLITVRKTIRRPDDPKDPDVTYNYYQLFWLVFEERQDLIRKLQFYRFYLSRISKTNTVEIILISNDNKNNLECFKKIAKAKGFGLWNIDLDKNTLEPIIDPLDYRERMAKVLENPKEYDPELLEFSKEITSNSKDISLFFDSFINESIEAMVGVSAKEIGKRNIERKVLDFVFEFRNISYKDELQELVSNHLIEKNDDYEFIDLVFSCLFKKCGVNTDYSKFLKIFEAPLYNIFSANKGRDPSYRDHYFHQFQVFIIGLRIIDKYYSRFEKDIEKQWLITAAFHDISYPIQKFDSWARKFFAESLNIPDLGVADMTKHFVTKSLLTCTADIISSICKVHFPEKSLNGNWLRKENKLIEIYHKIITESKHHALLSSIFLLKEAEKLKNEGLISEVIFDDLFIPAARAISLHHNVQYSIKNSTNDNINKYLWDELKSYGLKVIDFEIDFLSYLLIYTDSAQEWGRPTDDPITNVTVNEHNKTFSLKDFKITDSKCHIKLKANFLSTDAYFKSKILELETVSSFLSKVKKINFQITIIDCAGEIKEYFMKGA